MTFALRVFAPSRDSKSKWGFLSVRSFLTRSREGAKLLGLGIATTSSWSASAQTVNIDSGRLEGKTLPSSVRAWLGVPFAAPPLRELRWKAPQPLAKWGSIYHADRPAPMCLQPGRGRTMNHYFGVEATSEDCLYLNLWAPKYGEKLPVIVWIYGGAFNVGSASMANYSGEGLAEKGVVRVNLSYRVGPMGFLAHPDLTKEGGGHSGNYGLMDQVAGLEWVKRNIAAFGGDPDNVTIMGQSAGSMSVSLLQIDQKARGLFHKIVGMSGSPFGGMMAPVPLAEGEARGATLQAKLGVASIEAMRDIAGDRILAAANTSPSGAIVIDGAHIIGSPEMVFARGGQSDVPVLVGFTRDERFSNLGPAKTVIEYEALVRAAFPANAAAVLKAYPAKDEAGVQRALVDLMRDMSVGKQMYLWAAVNKNPSYGYFFTRRQPYTAGIAFSDHDPATVGAYHTGEVPYFLRSLESLNLFRKTRDWSAEDEALSDLMSRAIINFAKTGSPGADWSRFDAKRPRMMQLDLQQKQIDWPNAKMLHLLDGVPASPRPPEPGRVRD
jgi:para-nitrobenzyl esterase